MNAYGAKFCPRCGHQNAMDIFSKPAGYAMRCQDEDGGCGLIGPLSANDCRTNQAITRAVARWNDPVWRASVQLPSIVDEGTPQEQWNCGNHHLRAQCVAGVIVATLHSAPAPSHQAIQALDDLFHECGAAYCRALLDSKAFNNLADEVPF